METPYHYLVLAAIGADKPGIINDLSKAVTAQGGNILDSRMLAIGGEFSLIMTVSGEAEALPLIDHALRAQCDQLKLDAVCHKTHRKAPLKDSIPYRIQVVALDHPGIVQEVTGFYAKKQINIEDLKTDTYAAPLTGSPMFALELLVNIPTRLGLKEFKHQFFEFCDALNLDASIEPAR